MLGSSRRVIMSNPKNTHLLFSFLAIIMLALTTLTCGTPAEQAEIQTRAAQAGQTAVAQGKSYAETQAPKLKETAAAQLATEVAKRLNSTRKIGLDPGHGWQDSRGAEHNGLKEREVTLDIAFRTKVILEGYGFQAMMTRINDDTEHLLEYASQIVNQQNPTIVVSIHCNADSTGSGNGTEACYTVGKRTDANSKRLAQLLTDSVVSKLLLRNRGIFPENSQDRCARTQSTGRTKLYIHDMNPPAAIIETAFLSNLQEAELLKNRSQVFAQAIADGVLAYFQY
jgi:N-acetylmuramoyl-L-alanine amidase